MTGSTDSTSRAAKGSKQRRLIFLICKRPGEARLRSRGTAALAGSTDSPYSDAMNEHRITSRRRILKAGSIEFAGSEIACTVRNLSESGAALEVVTPLFIPDRFTLVVPSEPLKRPCHIVWRKEKRIGIAFD